MIQVETQISFGNQQISHHFTASCNRVVLFGQSGAGKSVLLKMLAGFFDPDRGRISVRSRVLFDTAERINIPIHQRRIGYLPQEYTLFPNLTVIENILYGLKVQKTPLDQSWFDYLISRLEIGDLLKRDPASLSGGQQQRVALARILIIRPDILLLDEPFTALDSAIRESLRDMVIELVDELNIMTLLVTHDLDEAFVFAQELALVHEGEVIEFGKRNDLYRHPQYAESAQLLGFCNVFPVVELSGGQATLSNGDRFHIGSQTSSDRPFFCIRPEHIMILRDKYRQPKPLPRNIVQGTIRQVAHHGRYVNLFMVTDTGLELRISVPVHVHDRLELREGGSLQAFLKEESIVMCHSLNKGV